jgi:hypothetical protein
MAYFHILSHPQGTNDTLRFKDLSEQQLRTTFRQQFPTPSRGDVSIIRTERPHDTEVNAYLDNFWEMVKRDMPYDGSPQYPVSPNAETAIRGAGVNITETFLREMESQSGNDRGLHGLTPGDLY